MRAPAAVLLISAAIGLTSCGVPDPVHDKAYFAAHPSERAQRLATCRNNPGQQGETPNCVNAVQADADAEQKRVFHPPPPPAAGVNNPNHL